MTEQDIREQAEAEVRRRVAAGRESGLYPADLEAQLTAQFVRSGKDPLLFERLDAARAKVEELRRHPFDRLPTEVTSDVPGGRLAHQVIAKAVARQMNALRAQVSAYADEVGASLALVVDAVDEIRAVVNNDVLGDIDAVHHRLVTLEHRLENLESADRTDQQQLTD